MPNSATFAALVETATKWLGNRLFVARHIREAARRARVCAFVMVSSVVKVFEETMKSVSSGSRSSGGLDEVRAVDVRNEAEGQ